MSCMTHFQLSRPRSTRQTFPDDGKPWMRHPHGERGKLVRGAAGGFYLHQGDGLDTSLEVVGGARGREPRPLFPGSTADHKVREAYCVKLTGITREVPEAAILFTRLLLPIQGVWL